MRRTMLRPICRVQHIADCEQLLASLQHLGVCVLSRTQPDVWPVQRQSRVACSSGLTRAANTQLWEQCWIQLPPYGWQCSSAILNRHLWHLSFQRRHYLETLLRKTDNWGSRERPVHTKSDKNLLFCLFCSIPLPFQGWAHTSPCPLVTPRGLLLLGGFAMAARWKASDHVLKIKRLRSSACFPL